MGLDLRGGIVRRVASMDQFQGRRVAIDAPNLMYAFFTTACHNGIPPEAAAQAARRSSIVRIFDLASWGARCVLVFDGEPHPLKREVLEARQAAREKTGTPRLTRSDYAPLEDLARALGVPVVHAPHDAEAQASSMSMAGLVDVVATTDWDALAMGATRLLRNLSASMASNKWEHVDAAEALRELGGLQREDLALAAVLMGCDYHPGYDGIGPKKGLAKAKVARDKQPDSPLRFALQGLGQPADDPRAHAALDLMLNPPNTPTPDLAWHAPTSEALSLLVELGLREDDARLHLGRLAVAHRRMQETKAAAAPPPPPEPTEEELRRIAAREEGERISHAFASKTRQETPLTRWT